MFERLDPDIVAKINDVWERHHVVRFSGVDMSNECRLAAVIIDLEAAIRKHRDAKGHDRCWENDEELWAVLGEKTTNRQMPSKEEFLKKCQEYFEDQTEKRTTNDLIEASKEFMNFGFDPSSRNETHHLAYRKLLENLSKAIGKAENARK